MYNEDGKIMSETSKTRRIIDSRQAGVTVGEKMIHANAFPFQFIQTDSPIYSCFGMKPNMTGIEIIGLAEGA